MTKRPTSDANRMRRAVGREVARLCTTYTALPGDQQNAILERVAAKLDVYPVDVKRAMGRGPRGAKSKPKCVCPTCGDEHVDARHKTTYKTKKGKKKP